MRQHKRSVENPEQRDTRPRRARSLQVPEAEPGGAVAFEVLGLRREFLLALERLAGRRLSAPGRAPRTFPDILSRMRDELLPVEGITPAEIAAFLRLYRIDVPWMIRSAGATLQWWRNAQRRGLEIVPREVREGERAIRFMWLPAIQIRRGALRELHVLSVEAAFAGPALVDRETAWALALVELRRAFERRWADAVAGAEAQGFEARDPLHPLRSRNDLAEHLEWLAIHHVLAGWTYERIAGACNVERNAVARAVPPLRELLFP